MDRKGHKAFFCSGLEFRVTRPGHTHTFFHTNHFTSSHHYAPLTAHHIYTTLSLVILSDVYCVALSLSLPSSRGSPLLISAPVCQFADGIIHLPLLSFFPLPCSRLCFLPSLFRSRCLCVLPRHLSLIITSSAFTCSSSQKHSNDLNSLNGKQKRFCWPKKKRKEKGGGNR